MGTKVGGGLILAILAALLYGLTLSRHFTADSLLYALAIEGDDLRVLIDPTHLLLHPLGLLWFRIWQAVGWVGRAIVPLQMLNALAGATCVGLMWALAHSLSHSLRAAIMVTLGFAVSGGMWLLSVEAEFVTVPLALQLMALWWILGIAAEHRERSWYAVSLGIIAAIAIFAYLTSIFLVLVALVGFMTADLAPKIKLRQIGLFLASILLLVIPLFWLALDTWLGGDLSLLKGLGGHGAYGVLHWFNVPHGFYTFLRSFGLFPGLAMNDSTQDLLAAAGNKERFIFFIYYGLIALLALLPFLYLVLHRHILWANAKRPLIVLLTWTITFASFAFYWVPGDITFWMPVLAAWWLITAICFTVGRASRWWSAAFAVVLLLGIVNATQVILPRTVLDRNQPYLTAKRIASETGAQDTILIDADDMALLTVAYFAERRALPLQTVVENLSELPDWIAAEAEEVKNTGGRLLIMDADGRLHMVEQGRTD